MPSKYFLNKPIDIQDYYKDYLLITTNLGAKDTDCCLELIFTSIELKDFIDLNDGFFLYPKPLPITRVKSVLFSDNCI